MDGTDGADGTGGTGGAGGADATGGPEDRLRRWRLVLGGERADGTGVSLTGDDARMDGALEKLYGGGGDEGRPRPGRRSAGLGDSAPSVARWLGDIREYFPSSVVQVLQKDAIERLDLTRLLLEPEMLDAVEPDVHLVGTLLSLNRVMPDRARESARAVVRKVVRDLERRLAQRTRSAVGGALDRSARVLRPRRLADVDWERTIRANLRHYLPEHGTLVPERLIGYGRRQQAVKRDVVLAIDQSGSMAASVVYASVFGAVLASMRSLRTSLVVFDTAVADLTDQLHDPVEVLFGTQLGGGTDINRAIAYCQGLVTRPADTIMVLISDLYEGGVREEMLRRIGSLTAAGVQVVVLLALSDEGAPAYDRDNAAALAALGVPAFACTPDAFPGLMAAAIERRDLAEWSERQASAG
ncbi:VWA domain containing CoxE-like protein [Actinomadura meyerae]|uniref:VWA domain containing CoxE-like protein n=1 Tax=Actinomadura meyerae TaxID=240840 RepID=A0A239H886_9ACTN|nr:VWA domain-containing protein [Actinomadura meyerae]SNS77570.1 VWA domain containing CoxE-like protein [Actinomadura meyerae]